MVGAALWAQGCVVPPEVRCPECQIVVGTDPFAIHVRPEARTLFVVIPGLLGYGWEWDRAVEYLRRAAPAVDFAVFWYRPGMSFDRGAGELARVVNKTWAAAPANLERIVLVAHSGGGNLALRATDLLRTPQGRRTVLATISTPLGGMGVLPIDADSLWRWPASEIILMHLRTYPEPAPGVDVIEFVTEHDPVTRPRGRHLPADPRLGPQGRERVILPGGSDHNVVVAEVVARLIERVRSAMTTPGTR